MQMGMILADMTPQNRNVARLACLAGQFSCSLGYIPFQNVILVFRHPDKMVLDIIDRMRAFAVSFAHGSPPMSDHITTSHVL